MVFPLLKYVGYWRDEEDSSLPVPADLVDCNWEIERRTLIIQYLRTGNRWMEALGFSFCRFQCGIEDEAMGNAELTDGEWVWPEGLCHYVEFHHVSLPQEFINTMENNKFKVPLLTICDPFSVKCTMSVWVSWASKQISENSRQLGSE